MKCLRMAATVLACVSVLALGAAAAPPARPMVLFGEVLVAGAPVAAGQAVVISVGTVMQTALTVEDALGRAQYSFTLAKPAGTLPVAVRFVSVAGRNVSGQIPDLSWQEGAEVRQLLAVNSAGLPAAPLISAAAATVSGGTCTLTCTLALPADTPAAATPAKYRVVWLNRLAAAPAAYPAAATGEPAIDHTKFPLTTFLAQATVTDISVPVSLTATLPAGLQVRFLELSVWGLGAQEQAGPQSGRVVVPVVQQGGI